MNKPNESLPLYRHKELYAWSEEYQKHKFFTERDFNDEKRLYDLEMTGKMDYVSGDIPPVRVYIPFRYSERYGTLKQDSVFYNNINLLSDIRYNSHNYAEYVMKSNLMGIDKKYVNFELLYHYFGRKRYFPYEYWKLSDPENYPQYNEWMKFRYMCKEAFVNGHRECVSYEEFIREMFK